MQNNYREKYGPWLGEYPKKTAAGLAALAISAAGIGSAVNQKLGTPTFVDEVIEYVDEHCSTEPPEFIETENNAHLPRTRTAQREANGNRRPITVDHAEELGQFFELQAFLDNMKLQTRVENESTGLIFNIYSDTRVVVDGEQLNNLFDGFFASIPLHPEPQTRARVECQQSLFVEGRLFAGRHVDIHVVGDPKMCRFRYVLASRTLDEEGNPDRCYTGRHLGGKSYEVPFRGLLRVMNASGVQVGVGSQILITPGMVPGRESNVRRANTMLVHELAHVLNGNGADLLGPQDTEAVTDAMEELLYAEQERLNLDFEKPVFYYDTSEPDIPSFNNPEAMLAVHRS